MKVQAFMYTYNEADIIRWSVQHAVDQGLRVHVTDNWSTDGTFELVTAMAATEPKITVSRWPESGPTAEVSWHEMLTRVEQLALNSGADWCMHYDADEIRRSGRPGERLFDAVKRLSQQGFSAIDHRVEVYAPRDGYDGAQNPEEYLSELIPNEHMDQKNGQVKCWQQRRGRRVSLAAGAGHRVDFPGIKIATEQLVLKHYPLRSPEQQARKLAERRERWAASDRARAWHVQYDGIDGQYTPAIVTLTRFPQIFHTLRDSLTEFEPTARKIVVTSGGAKIHAPGWTVIEGAEPFIFARNANLGIAAVPSYQDVLLLNDDCVLQSSLTPILSRIAHKRGVGILSPQIIGDVGNPLQRAGAGRDEVYLSEERLAFVCVYLPAATRRAVGPLDEQFAGYGGDDVDYCVRAQKAGLTLGVTANAVVKHGHGKHRTSSSFYSVMTKTQRDASMAEMDQLVEKKHGRRR